MSKCKTLDEAIMRYGVSKIAFRCAIVVRREKKLRWQQVEPIIGESRYASGLYFDYMQLLHERGVVGQIEIEQIRQTMRLTH